MSSVTVIGSGHMAAALGGLAAKAGHTVDVMDRGEHRHPGVPYAVVLDVVERYGEQLAGLPALGVQMQLRAAPGLRSMDVGPPRMALTLDRIDDGSLTDTTRSDLRELEKSR